MKILLVINSLGGGGAERVVQTLSSHFAQRGFEVHVVTLERGEDTYPLHPEVRRVTLRSAPLARGPGRVAALPLQALELARVIRRVRPDAALSFLVRANLAHASTRAFGNRLPRLLSERNVTDHRYPGDGPGDRAMRLLVAAAYRRSDGVAAISGGVADALARLGVPPERVRVIHNPQDLGLIRRNAVCEPELRLPPGPLVASVGRLVEQKGYPMLLEAFSRLRARREARLVVLGEGPLEAELERTARRLSIAEDVVFAGQVENPFALMARCDLFALSSRWEGFGNVVVEAMACGLPVVSSDCPGGPREILEDGKCGVLVPPGDAGRMADEIDRLLGDAGERQRLVELGARRAEDFDVQVVARRYLEFMGLSEP